MPVSDQTPATELRAGDVVVWHTGRRSRLARVSVKPAYEGGPTVVLFEWGDGLGPYASEPNATFRVEREPVSLVRRDESYL